MEKTKKELSPKLDVVFQALFGGEELEVKELQRDF